MHLFETPQSPLSDLFAQGCVTVFAKDEAIPTEDAYYQVVSGYIALCEASGGVNKKLVFLFGKNDIFPYPFQLYTRKPERMFQYCAIDTSQLRHRQFMGSRVN